MIEEFEYEGVWWLPDNPEIKIPGILKFTPTEGAVLKLSSDNEYILAMFANSDPEIILGISSNGKYITLYKCLILQPEITRIDSYSLGSIVFGSQMVLVGSHFQKPEDIKFKSMSIHYLYLNEWFKMPSFKLRRFENETIKKMIIECEIPEPIPAIINDYKILLEVRILPPSLSSIEQGEVNIKQKTYIKIEPSENKSLDEFLNIIYLIQGFLSLGALKPSYPLIIEGETRTNKYVKLYYRMLIPKVTSLLHPQDMLFTFQDIPDFETFIKNWFEKANLLEPVYYLYLITLYDPDMYIEQQLLSLVGAIEAYHRRTMDNFELPKEQHNKRLEEILRSVPEEYKGWLNEKLSYSNEKSLRKRLKEVVKEFDPILKELIPVLDSFVDKVVKTRNYLTHNDEKLKDQAATGKDLLELVENLKIIAEICLLKELGFTLDKIKNLISRNRKTRKFIK